MGIVCIVLGHRNRARRAWWGCIVTGLDYLKLTRPCGGCPFIEGRFQGLAADRRAQIAESLRRGESFTCHRTIDYGADVEQGDRARLCAGAVATLEASGEREPTIRQVARRLGVDVPDVAADGVTTLDEWIAAGARWSRDDRWAPA